LELESFDEIKTAKQEEAFAALVETIYEWHSKVLLQMARGAYEFQQAVRKEGHHAKEPALATVMVAMTTTETAHLFLAQMLFMV